MPKLTDRFIKSLVLAAGQKDRLVFDDEVRGLGVRVTAKGTKAFIVQWTDKATGRKVREPVGVWGSITVEQARDAARSKLGDVAKGVDPAAERKRKQAEAAAEKAENALSLDALLTAWAELHLVRRRPRYAAEAVRTVRLAFASHLKAPAIRLSRKDALQVLDDISASGRQALAVQVMGHARAAYTWAEKRGRVSSNPFRNLPLAASVSERDRTLDEAETAEVWAAAGTLPYPFGPFFRLALLTLQRREEVAGMRWSELSADRTLWTIPAERMKNNRPHDVQLSPAARDVLAPIPKREKCDLVFTTNGRTSISGYSRAKAALDNAIVKARAKAAEKAGAKPAKLVPWRVHDFRRTGVSRLAALGFDSIVADKLLAHKPAKLKGVASVYQRHDFAAERRRALEVWADHVVGAKPGGNVVAMRRLASAE